MTCISCSPIRLYQYSNEWPWRLWGKLHLGVQPTGVNSWEAVSHDQIELDAVWLINRAPP
jgi:hypothetical protein